ncbi:MAG: hypothetical protein OCD76_00095 [Reichenbachiella sp.]
MRTLSLILMTFWLYGCGDSQATKHPVKIDPRKTLNINFDTNINSTDPSLATTESELFIKNLLYDSIDEQFVAGKFELIISDDDILYVLKRKIPQENKINTVNIRFIKNRKSIIKELLLGQLDIIKADSSYQLENEVIKIINDPYHQIKKSKTITGSISYWSFYNCSDSLIKTLSQQLLDSSAVLYPLTTIEGRVFMDTIPLVYHSSATTIENHISKNYPIVTYQTRQHSNLNLPNIQLKDTLVSLDKYSQSISAMSIDTIQFDYYLYNSNLSTINDFSEISKDIDLLNHKIIRRF